MYSLYLSIDIYHSFYEIIEKIFLLCGAISALFAKDFSSTSTELDGFESTWIATLIISFLCFLFNLTEFIAYLFNIIGLRSCSSKKGYIEIMVRLYVALNYC